ncbi:hypothetical protein SL034_004280 [Vibrio harveyi]|uniref:hypothetical protein n=1 Tax=Vibrio harveyi group TaxID=717610 RepID=UPI0009719BA6|nr:MULTISPECIES: hypothetical protein [Vibrio harveyi group]APX10109.1 hypothetical protein BWP24_28380 [Vibrio campbellii]ELY1989192.1 hypothetical protein [Vibrio harveyi]WCP78874.1 hypothetical protein PPW95_25570 [Vibrio parahaemolyticus]
MNTKLKLITVGLMLASMNTVASQMTFNDLKNRTDGFTTQKPSQATMDNSWRTYNKPAVNDSSSGGGGFAQEILYKNSNGLDTDTRGVEIKLSKPISNFGQIMVIYQMQHEGAGVHSITMTIPTSLWLEDPTHTKSTADGAFYRYTDTSGADKDRWSVAHFWRTGKDTLWFSKNYDRYSAIKLSAVVGIGSPKGSK